MTDTNQTLFQQLVVNHEVPNMIADLERLRLNDETNEYEFRMSFTDDDIPRILEELRELQDMDDGE